MASRGARRGPRRGAPSSRSRGARSTPRGRGSVRGAGVQKTPATRVRPIQPRITAAIQPAINASRNTAPSATATTENFPRSSSGPEVTRNHNAKFMCNPASLFFVYLGGLQSTPDAETIALNLTDYFLQLPISHYPAELWYGHLHATCFLLASDLTGCENEVEDVCRAVEMQAAGLVAMGADEESLKVPPEQVLAGLRVMVGWGREIMGCVGGYDHALANLSGRMSGGGSKVGEAEHQYHADDAEGLTSMDTSIKEKDLVDFDTFDEV
ncbi:hypothetical protein LTR86_007922 [Recurvomyces mirabilis]|nr:hypothetical protein LTR86_007922 [Recurvomyces mirabilis]